MEINIIQLVGQIVNIIILVWLLNKFLYKPILKVVDDRNRRIQEGLELGKKNEQEREKIEKLRKQKLAEAEKKVVNLIQQAKQEASLQSKEILAQAKKQAQEEAAKQRRLLLEEIEQEREKIKAEVADLVVETSRKLLVDLLDPKSQKKIIESELKSLKKVNW